MSNIVTDWRVALVTLLDSDLQSGSFTVVSGERDGVSRDRKLACVFAAPLISDTDIGFDRPAMIVRAWLPTPKQVRATSPLDPSDVEQLMVDLLTVLDSGRTSLVPGRLVYYCTRLVPDYADQGVEATLVGWTENPALLA